MLRLAGALTTFALNESVRDLPDYDHDDLGRSFTELDAQIRKLLEIVRKSKCIAIPLLKTGRFIWKGSIHDERQLDATHFILSVDSQTPVEELISKFQRLARVSAPDDLALLIQKALPGVSLRHMGGQIPASVPINLSCQYFSLSGIRTALEQHHAGPRSQRLRARGDCRAKDGVSHRSAVDA